MEEAILQTKTVKDVYVTGEKSDYWGEIIVAFYIPINHTITIEVIKEKLLSILSKYKIPKKWYLVNDIERNSRGKITPSYLQNLYSNILSEQS